MTAAAAEATMVLEEVEGTGKEATLDFLAAILVSEMTEARLIVSFSRISGGGGSEGSRAVESESICDRKASVSAEEDINHRVKNTNHQTP